MDKRISAFGMHDHNKFGMTATYSPFSNMTFDNVGRRVYFGEAGDPSNPQLMAYGTNTPAYVRMWMADGEKRSHYYDLDGSTTGIEKALMITKVLGCNIYFWKRKKSLPPSLGVS